MDQADAGNVKQEGLTLRSGLFSAPEYLLEKIIFGKIVTVTSGVTRMAQILINTVFMFAF